MPLSLPDARRFSRQIALPEIGSAGQARLAGGTVLVIGGGLAGETAAIYLAAAGVGRLRLVAASEDAARVRAAVMNVRSSAAVEARVWPREAAAWVDALEGVGVAVRLGLDDDPLLRACVGQAAPVVFARAGAAAVDVIAFRAHGPCPHLSLDLPVRRAEAIADEGAADVVGGTLAAAEALWILLGRAPTARASHLRVPLDGGDALVQEIPWAPECSACGGDAREAIFP